MPTDRRIVDPLLRASLVVEAALAAALDAPTVVRSVLTAAALVAVLGSAVRGRDRGRLDAVLVGLAGTVAGLVLLGLLLNLFPVGLTRVTWAAGAGVLGLAAVFWGALYPRPVEYNLPFSTSALLRHGPWVVAAAGVSAVAVVVAVHATDVANRPPVQLSLTSATASTVSVQATGSRAGGNYQIVVMRGATEVNRSKPFALRSGQRVAYRFTPVSGRVTVTLSKVGNDTPTRSLVINGAR